MKQQRIGPVMEDCLYVVDGGSWWTTTEVVRLLGEVYPISAVRAALHRLEKRGLVVSRDGPLEWTITARGSQWMRENGGTA